MKIYIVQTLRTEVAKILLSLTPPFATELLSKYIKCRHTGSMKEVLVAN